mmetsp:Transcript_26495/g.64569  ORF Transcript_26495/g.64569 Transcript_26495/m.64569 type:complete len:127 (+) Transcript_26495:1068-1448(+)
MWNHSIPSYFDTATVAEDFHPHILWMDESTIGDRLDQVFGSSPTLFSSITSVGWNDAIPISISFLRIVTVVTSFLVPVWPFLGLAFAIQPSGTCLEWVEYIRICKEFHVSLEWTATVLLSVELPLW